MRTVIGENASRPTPSLRPGFFVVGHLAHDDGVPGRLVRYPFRQSVTFRPAAFLLVAAPAAGPAPDFSNGHCSAPFIFAKNLASRVSVANERRC